MMKGIENAVSLSEDDLVRSHSLLAHINDIQSVFIAGGDGAVLFEKILRAFLSLSDSRFGFIGEVRSAEKGARFLRMHAISNIVWDAETRNLYIKHSADGMELHDFNTLFGHAITSGAPVLSNDPAHDPRSKGLPKGHPSLESFLGIPFVCCGRVIGMAGLANCPGGYREEIIDYLRPIVLTTTCLIGAYEEKKQRLSAQKAQTDAEALYRNLFETSLNGIGIIQSNRLVSANSALLDMFGYFSIEELAATPLLEIMASESRDLVDALLKKYNMGESASSHFRCRIIRRDGTKRYLEASINAIEVDSISYTLGTFTDITGKKRNLDRLLQSYNMLMTVLDSLNAIIYVSSMQTHEILYINRYGRAMFGNVEGEKCWRTLQRDQHGPCSFCNNHRLLDEQGNPAGVIEYEYRNTKNDLWYAAMVQAITWVDGQTVRMEIATDVTERRRLQDEAIRSSHLISIGELTAGVAHEINNPISGIILNAEILADKLGLSDNMHLAMVAGQIKREADRIGDVVSSLLGFARVDEEPRHSAISMDDILRELLVLCKSQCFKDGIVIDIEVPEDLPRVCITMNKALQIFLNLFSNARYSLNQKYSNQRAEKILRLTCEQVLYGDNLFVRSMFYDNGTGIPADLVEKIKNPFFTTKPRGQGTGLGLSIIQSILNDVGGHLSIESEVDEFASFIVDVPAEVNFE